MRVSVISKADAFGGGASKIAVNLTAAVSQPHCQVTHYVGWAGRERLRDTYPAHVKPIFGQFPLRFATKCALAAEWQLGIPEAIPLELLGIVMSGVLDADIIHVHDITEVLSPLSLLWLSRRKPLIWTLHDCSPFTAGCITAIDKEALDCHRWTAEYGGCDRTCPKRRDRHYPFGGWFNGIPLLWREKQLLSKFGELHLTAPSNWLADEVQRSCLYFGRRPSVISNGIDVLGCFAKRSKNDCKEALGLLADRYLMALMASDLNDSNKGFAWAVETLHALPPDIKSRLQLICIGTRNQTAVEQLADYNVYWADYVQDQRLLSTMLNAADLMLYPSLADNQPLAVIEALACGTPVFSFATGGIPETIGNDAGVIVARKDTQALAAAISSAIRNGQLPAMSAAARLRAESHFSRETMASNFLELYRTVLDVRPES
jgi:glycosyltransferase involved in cell wall biosynthesis